MPAREAFRAIFASSFRLPSRLVPSRKRQLGPSLGPKRLHRGGGDHRVENGPSAARMPKRARALRRLPARIYRPRSYFSRHV